MGIDQTLSNRFHVFSCTFIYKYTVYKNKNDMNMQLKSPAETNLPLKLIFDNSCLNHLNP